MFTTFQVANPDVCFEKVACFWEELAALSSFFDRSLVVAGGWFDWAHIVKRGL